MLWELGNLTKNDSKKKIVCLLNVASEHMNRGQQESLMESNQLWTLVQYSGHKRLSWGLQHVEKQIKKRTLHGREAYRKYICLFDRNAVMEKKRSSVPQNVKRGHNKDFQRKCLTVKKKTYQEIMFILT